MKKHELTHIIREIVAQEIRKELPTAIAEVFSNFMGKRSMVTEQMDEPPPTPPPNQNPEGKQFRQSLKELFAGTNVVTEPRVATKEPRQFSKDPKINAILNETAPFSAQQKTGGVGGMAAVMAAQQASVAPMAAMPIDESAGEPTPSYLRNMPDMGNVMPSHASAAPISQPVSQAALLNDNHVPLADLPEGVSVMDVKQHAPPEVQGALTRNYSQMLKLIDKKKGKV